MIACDVCGGEVDAALLERIELAREGLWHDNNVSRFRFARRDFTAGRPSSRGVSHVCRRCWVTLLDLAAYHARRVLLGDLRGETRGLKLARLKLRVRRKLRPTEAEDAKAIAKQFSYAGNAGWLPVDPSERYAGAIKALRQIASALDGQANGHGFRWARGLAKGALKRAGERLR